MESIRGESERYGEGDKYTPLTYLLLEKIIRMFTFPKGDTSC